jgi:hypothetical protein
LLVVWLPFDVRGFRPVLARGWHGARSSMRTTGASLLRCYQCSSGHVLTTAQDGRSVCGLLYLAAVGLRGRVCSLLMLGLVAQCVCLIPAFLFVADAQRSVFAFLPHVSKDIGVVLYLSAAVALRQMCAVMRHLTPLAKRLGVEAVFRAARPIPYRFGWYRQAQQPAGCSARSLSTAA